jgi:hypothetical protein
MSPCQDRRPPQAGCGPAWVYLALLVAFMAFSLALVLVGDSLRYPSPALDSLGSVVADAIKILLGAVIGALTPGVLGKLHDFLRRE